MLLAGFLGSAFITVVPFETLAEFIPSAFGLKNLLLYGTLLSVVGLFLPVPMAFDVIVVAILLEAGLPIEYGMILLFTLGIFSVYPFFHRLGIDF